MALLKEESYTIEDIYALPDGERAELIDTSIIWHHHRTNIRNSSWSFPLSSVII